ncbi:MAG: 4'-phosphopantetheinyl transferase EntD [Candidatus Paceibacteria bacterium]
MQNLFSVSVAVAVMDPRLDQGSLLAAEAGVVQKATASRIREFTAGRVAARVAMLAIGLPVLPVPSGPDRAPIWPQQISGSISHCLDCCVAVVAPACDVATLGIDVEACTPLDPDLFDIVFTSAEKNWLQLQAPEMQGYLAKLIFSAKETTYKCQYPLSGQVLDFQAVEINFDLKARRFGAVFKRDAAPFQTGDKLVGAFDIVDQRFLTGMSLA